MDDDEVINIEIRKYLYLIVNLNNVLPNIVLQKYMKNIPEVKYWMLFFKTGLGMENIKSSGHWIWSLKGLLLIVVLYSLIHIAIRAIASDVIGQDDVVGNLFSQMLAPGYIPRQGPLYDWLLWCVQQFTGPYIISFLVLKYALVGTTLIFIYLTTRDIFGSHVWALFTAVSMSLMYQIGWNVHEGVTHTAALMMTIAGTFWAFVRLSNHSSLSNYVIFGALLGLGFLSKHTFGVFALILLISCMFQSGLRKVILRPLFLISLVTALLVALPYILWLVEKAPELSRDIQLSTGVSRIPYFERLAIGLPKIITSPAGFLFPLLIILPLVFPRFLKTFWIEIKSAKEHAENPDHLRLIIHMMLASFIAIALAVVVLGVTRLEERYMHPFFLVTVIGLVGIALKSCTDMKILNRYVTVLLAFAVVVMGIRITNLVVGAPLCGKCREFVPYNQLAEILKQKGYQGGTIVTGYRHLAGNLRRLFPKDRIISVIGPTYSPPFKTKARPSQSVVAVWDPKMNKGVPPARIKYFLAKLGVKKVPEVQTVRVPWKHRWKKDGYRYSTWKLVVIPVHRQHQKIALPRNNR